MSRNTVSKSLLQFRDSISRAVTYSPVLSHHLLVAVLKHAFFSSNTLRWSLRDFYSSVSMLALRRDEDIVSFNASVGFNVNANLSVSISINISINNSLTIS